MRIHSIVCVWVGGEGREGVELRFPVCSVSKDRPSAPPVPAPFAPRPIAASLLRSSPSPPRGSSSRRCCSETHGNGRKIGYAAAVSKPAFSSQNNKTKSRIFLSFLCCHLLLFISEGEFRRAGTKMVRNTTRLQHCKQIPHIVVSNASCNPWATNSAFV